MNANAPDSSGSSTDACFATKHSARQLKLADLTDPAQETAPNILPLLYPEQGTSDRPIMSRWGVFGASSVVGTDLVQPTNPAANNSLARASADIILRERINNDGVAKLAKEICPDCPMKLCKTRNSIELAN